MKKPLQTFIMLAGLLATTHSIGAASEAKIVRMVDPPRSIGIHIGDVITRTVEIEVQPPYQLSKNTLPVKGSSQNGIELADIQVSHQKNSDIITLQYQVFASLPTPGVMQLPAEKFALTGGPKALAVSIPAWRFWFSPLVTAEITHAKENLQPQSPPSLIDTSEHQQRLMALLALCVIGIAGLVYINGEKRWLPFMNGAFSQAHRKLKKMPKTRAQLQPALLHMHQAFNQVHGSNLFANDIDHFLAKHPEFSKLKPAIQRFFEESGKLLFTSQQANSESFINNLVALSKNLRDCERRVA